MEILKSPNDYRKYRIVNLKNGVKALLISDIDDRKKEKKENGKEKDGNDDDDGDGDGDELEMKETKLAAAALCLQVGSIDDPDEIPGLAHFLEHMVFMGSKKYSKENDFDSFLKLHGGADNAHTGWEFTNFYFHIQPEHFEESLDRFSQFFISPLLREDAVKRELKAVDSEFKNVIQEDVCRIEQLVCHVAKKSHPLSRFTWGNKLSLSKYPKKKGIDVMKSLREFFNHYCDRQATLCLCSTEPLDKLEELADKYFSSLTPRQFECMATKETKFENPFDSDDFHKLYYVKPVRDHNVLILKWAIPSQYKNYRTDPMGYIEFLLGHEGYGSLHSYFLKKGYISELCCWEESYMTFGFLLCFFELTDEGIQNIEEVIHAFFQYVKMMQDKGACKRLHDELQMISSNEFRFLEPMEPEYYVEALVEDMHLCNDTDILTKNILLQEYNKELIEDMQRFITPENVIIVVSSKKFNHLNYDEKEPWFKTKFLRKDIPSTWLDKEQCEKVNDELYLPHENQFIAKDFEIKKPIGGEQVYPVVIDEASHYRIWYKQDQKFGLPKAIANFKLSIPTHGNNLHNVALLSLFEHLLGIVGSALHHETGMANMAQFSYHSITLSSRVFEVSGYNDKLLLVFEKHFEMLMNFTFTVKEFNVAKENLRRDIRNDLLGADRLASVLEDIILYNWNENDIEILKLLDGISIASFQEFKSKYLREMYIEALFQGNILREDVEKYIKFIEKFVERPVLRENIPKPQCLKLPIGRTVVRHNGFNPNDPNTVVNNYYQVGPVTFYLNTVAGILETILQEPTFDYLRTQKQLGYSVYCENRVDNGIIGIGVSVQTSKFSANEVDKEIENFLTYFEKKFSGYSEDEYQKYIASFVKNCKQADLSLSDETYRNWSTIGKNEYLFGFRLKKIEMAEKITKEEVLDFFKNYLLDEENRRVLSVQVIGHVKNRESSDSDSDSGSSDDSSSDDDDDDDDDNAEDEDAKNEEKIPCPDDVEISDLTLINVGDERYSDCITNIEAFRERNGFYKYCKLEY